MGPSLPDRVSKYAETTLFSERTIPDKLTSDHDLKAGVWGKISVLVGGLEFHVQGEAEQIRVIKAGEHAIIEPEQVHFVRPMRQVEFKIEFYR